MGMGFARADIGAGLSGFMRLTLGCGWTSLALAAAPGGPAHALSPRLTAGEEAKSFALAPGLQITLVADGSVINEPLAAQFGADGRLWVLELGVPPAANAPEEERGPGGLAVLEDTNGDGRMDRRTTFASGFRSPTGLALAGRGAMVFDPPHYWFLRDANGDSVADERTWMTSEYLAVPVGRYGSNSLTLAMDNWLYSPVGSTRLRYAGAAGFERDLTARRGGRSVTRDDTGRLYHGGDGRTLYVDRLPLPYVRRNLGFKIFGTPEAIAIGRPTEGTGKDVGGPSVEAERDSPSWSMGDALIFRERGSDWDGEVFVTEPANGRVWRSPLGGSETRSAGAVVSSTDPNFRPVSLTQGPDGAIYVVDRYGAGTAKAAEVRREAGDKELTQGGRIWRIARAAKGTIGPKLADASVSGLVEALGDDSGWRRDTAQRLLVERADPAAPPLLREFATKAATPLGRLQALWTLDGLDAVDPRTTLSALGDADPRVRAGAIRLAERFFFAEDDLKVFRRLEEMAADPDREVALQLALSLGEVGTNPADAILRGLLARWGDQPGFIGAVLSGMGGREVELIAELAKISSPPSPALARTAAAATEAVLDGCEIRRMVVGFADHARVNKLLEIAAESATPGWLRAAILEGVERHIPRTSSGQLGLMNLGGEPGALARLSADGDPALAARVQKIMRVLNWPGKAQPAGPVSAPLPAEQKAIYEKGRIAFAVMCAGCHQPQGQGFVGFSPPLAGSRWVQGDERILARIVLCGKVQSPYSMPAFRAPFDDAALAAMLTFIRNTWGNAAGPVSPAVLAEVRAATADRQPMAFTDFELIELAQEYAPR